MNAAPKSKVFTKLFGSALLAVCACCAASANAQVTETKSMPTVSNDWRFSITPYLWLTNFNGGVYYGDKEIASASISAGNILSNFNYGGMVELEAHKGDFGVAVDLIYADLSGAKSKPIGPLASVGASTTVTQGIYTVVATYTVANSSQLYTDAVLGARMVTVSSSTSFNVNGNSPLGLSVSTSKTLTDPVIGLKGRIRISDTDWFIPFYVDVGGGGSTQFTTQAFLGVGYSLSWGDVIVGAKNLYYSQKNEGITSNMDTFGAALGVSFKF